MPDLTFTKKETDALLQIASQLTVVAVIGRDGTTITKEMLKRIDLDETTLYKITDLIGIPQEPEFQDNYTSWVNRAYFKIVGAGSGEPTASQTSRFLDAVNSIPDWRQYAALFCKFSSYWPENPNRLCRPDDIGHPACPPDDETLGLYEQAVDFLKQDTRIEYIKTGKSDLEDAFDPKTQEWLHKHVQVHVLNDLSRFTDTDLLKLFPKNPAVAHTLCFHRAEQITKNEGGG